MKKVQEYATKKAKNFAIKMGCVGVMFLVFSPFFVIMMRPQDDVAYYLGQPEKVALDSASPLKHNQFVKVEAKIRPENFAADRNGIIDSTLNFKFQLVGYPDEFIVHVSRGALHEELTQASRANQLPAVFAKAHSMEGRIHKSDISMDDFATYAKARDARLSGYLRHVFKDTGSAKKTYYLLAVDEVPNPGEFMDSNGGTTLIGLLLGIGAVVGIGFWIRRKAAQTPPPPPPP